MKLLASNWVAPVLALVLYLATTAAILKQTELTVTLPKKAEHPVVKAVLLWDASSPEVDQMIDHLRKEKEEMAARQKELAELTETLDRQRAELNQATQLVVRLQRQLEENLTRVKEDEQQNLKKLAKVYAGMSPDGAAGIVKNMQDAEAAKLMMVMKDAETGPILEALSKLGPGEAKRAAVISDKLRLAIKRSGNAPATLP